MNEFLATWRDSALGGQIVVNDVDIDHEANENCWTFALSNADSAKLTVANVKEFLDAVIRDRRASLRAMAIAPGAMRFYCWHDAMAAHLCFSLVSTTHGRLPFGCDLTLVAEPDGIIDSFLKSPYHDGIPWNELSENSDDDEPEPEFPPLDVWVISIP